MSSSLKDRVVSASLGLMTAAAVASLPLASIGLAAAVKDGLGNEQVTFTRDIAPILQRSCQSCHHPSSIAPMSLLGEIHQAPDRASRQAAGDAAVVHREEHRHPAVQERHLIER